MQLVLLERFELKIFKKIDLTSANCQFENIFSISEWYLDCAGSWLYSSIYVYVIIQTIENTELAQKYVSSYLDLYPLRYHSSNKGRYIPFSIYSPYSMITKITHIIPSLSIHIPLGWRNLAFLSFPSLYPLSNKCRHNSIIYFPDTIIESISDIYNPLLSIHIPVGLPNLATSQSPSTCPQSLPIIVDTTISLLSINTLSTTTHLNFTRSSSISRSPLIHI